MCGGKTEEIYFKHYKNMHNRDLRNISIKVVTHKKSNPMAVVQVAMKHRSDFDEVWAIFDKDDFTDFDDAINLALNNMINCAFSNEAIEYWFYLHFDNRTGSMSRQMLKTELERNLGFEYSKEANIIKKTCNRISDKLPHAEEWAQIGHERHLVNSGDKPANWRSCSTIYILTKRLREWSRANN